eukprot:GDKJ01047877.1.p1 GENE.GDKJ01047877.1~~GDKJ01047877.1.p1  ORF type:complete len:851 (-),score=149.18 GDKJ01047877.1:710-3262(-)
MRLNGLRCLSTVLASILIASAHREEHRTPQSYTILPYQDESAITAIKAMWNQSRDIDETVNRTLVARPLREAVEAYVSAHPDALLSLGLPVIAEEKQTKDPRRLQSTTSSIVYDNIRVTADTSGATLGLTSSNALALAVSWIESTFRIVRVSGIFKTADGTASCYQAMIPSKYKTGVTNTDYLLLVTTTTSSCSSNTLGWALSCQIDQNDRPVVGQLNVCQNNLNSNDLSYVTNFFIHEILHAMGFDSSSFAFFRNPYQEMAPLTPRLASGLPTYTDTSYVASTNTLATETTAYNTQGFYVVTPVIRDLMRAYSGCSTVPGAALEDEGGSSSAASHFEKRVFGPDVMTGVTSRFPMMSAFSLALLEDSGWYVPKYSEVVEIMWSRKNFSPSTTENERCGLVSSDRTCPLFPDSALTSESQFCSDSSPYRSCSHDASASTLCSQATFENGCRIRSILLENSNDVGDAVVYSNCDRKEFTTIGKTGELRADYSMCTDSSLLLTGTMGVCYPMICYLNTSESQRRGYNVFESVDVHIKATSPSIDSYINCSVSEKGAQKGLNGFEGSITCPDIAKVCFNRPCVNGGFFKHQRCVCRPGWTGTFCELADNPTSRAKLPAPFTYEYTLGRLQVGSFYSLLPIPHHRQELMENLSVTMTWSPKTVTYAAVTSLPEGLVLNPSTGVIEGIPTQASPCTPYTLTAFIDGDTADDYKQQARVIVEFTVVDSNETLSIPQTYSEARSIGCTKIVPTASQPNAYSAPTPTAAPTMLDHPKINWIKVVSTVSNNADPSSFAGTEPLVQFVTPYNRSDVVYEASNKVIGSNNAFSTSLSFADGSAVLMSFIMTLSVLSSVGSF